jgi:hypothetical protein
MVYVRKSCLARPAAELGISIRTRYILSVLRISADFDPRPGVEGTGLCLRSVNPYLCPILGARVHRSNQVLAVTWSLFCPKFDGYGGGPPS